MDKNCKLFFSGTLRRKHVTGEPYNFIGFDQFSKTPLVWVCKSNEAKEVTKLLESFINLNGVPIVFKLDRVVLFYAKTIKCFLNKKHQKRNNSTENTHQHKKGDYARDTVKSLIIANLEIKIGFTENINRASRGMYFTIHTGLRVNSFHLDHGRRLETQLTDTVKHNERFSRMDNI